MLALMPMLPEDERLRRGLTAAAPAFRADPEAVVAGMADALDAILAHARTLSRRLGSMARDADGSVTLEVRHDRPAEARVPNWLPCPRGGFGLTFRTYVPRHEIRDGSWRAPPVVAEAASR